MKHLTKKVIFNFYKYDLRILFKKNAQLLILHRKKNAEYKRVKYLGANVTSNRDLKEEVKAQTMKAMIISK